MREETSLIKKKFLKVTGSRPTRERVRTMTKREFLNAIVSANVNEEITAHAIAELEKMDYANAVRREKVSKKALENAPLVEQVIAMLGTEPLTATDIAAALEVSPQKASALARIAVGQGAAVAQDVKGPKGKCKGYTAC